MFSHIRQQMIERVIKEKKAALAPLNDRDDEIQAIQYENVGLQGEIKTKDQTIRDLIANRHVPRSGGIDTALVAVEKNEEHGKVGRHPYYLVRYQNRALKNRLDLLRVK